MPSDLAQHWVLNPEIDFLNHGSFGATPRVVLEAQREFLQQLERDPISFLAPERSLLPRLDQVRALLADLVHAPDQDIAFVRNATEGVNAVLRSFPFRSGDQVLVTDHGYNACNNAARFAAERFGASVVHAEVPFPIESPDAVLQAVEEKINGRTRLLLIDHVTSPTGLVFPLAELIALAHQRGVRVLVDGAHAAGMLQVDLSQLDPDYYTANHHKWLCGPKSSAFLYVRREFQPEIRPTSISHGANRDSYGVSRFLAEFNWLGTYDPSPLLAMPRALEFLRTLVPGGIEGLMRHNRQLALSARDHLLTALGQPAPSPPEMIGSLASVPLPIHGQNIDSKLETLRGRLAGEFRIEVPIFRLANGVACVRISAQAYNDLGQYDRLAEALVRCGCGKKG
ncbi:aminotransferase class V-fold PLP-dependent enzyme [Roseiconus nitratireducens]|uniref:aminotransferase class V-fold PLP-dependent enzyme n=1 Tax=Roseiconus nitratireducens TaxID=2605748 RepID=UPI001F2D6D2D|nr:aminotransferase class V-fold PLP-dependent enzyme [Roseiconus nitratireducens]